MDQSNQKLPNKIENIKKGPCGCIPDCSLYQYPIESSFGTLDPTVYYSANGFSKNFR